MVKTLKTRKSPSESATQFNIGTRKKGNDGNMWEIVKNKNGVKRWCKVTKKNTTKKAPKKATKKATKKTTKKAMKKTEKKKSKRMMKLESDPESVWGKRPELEEFWEKLASGKEVILMVKGEKKPVKYIMPKPGGAAWRNKYKELEEDENNVAIITSAQSTDTYESLYVNAKGKSPQYILDHYKKYLFNSGQKDDKSWYL